MKVAILNQQRQTRVGTRLKLLIECAVRESLKFFELRTDVEISVVLTDNEEIRTLNKLHRDLDQATDVLSFPMFEYDEAGDIQEDYAELNEMGEICLGDIVISLERATEQAEEYGHSFEREVGFLTVHSMLHLLGFDHMTDDDEKVMFGYQDEILDCMELKR